MSFLSTRHPPNPHSLEADNLAQQPFYRPAKPLTYELQNHSNVLLEEGQYVGGFTFLGSLLISGTSISSADKPYPAWVPGPHVLALASSLVAYPVLTTKAKTPERRRAADAALHYLRTLCRRVNPTTDNLLSGFHFTSGGSRRRDKVVETDSPGNHDAKREIQSKAATDESLWRQAEDFWHVVGWAFNCSLRYNNRWERWKLWLGIMLEFLEVDWAERVKLAQRTEADAEIILTSSLIWQYITSQDPTNRASKRRILRAILANGTSQPRKEFPEVWVDETKEREHKEEDASKRKKALDIEKGEFGEYDTADDEDEVQEERIMVSSRPTRRAAKSQGSNSRSTHSSEESDGETSAARSGDGVERLGGLDSVILRQRLLALLVQIAQMLPMQFTNLDDLFDLYTEFFRPLSTTLFAALLNTSTLPPSHQIVLNANLLLPLVSTPLPNYTVLSPTQQHLEKHFLPNSSSSHSFSSNAKISLIMESIFTQMMNAGELKATDALREAMEKGIMARRKTLGDARRKKGNAQEEDQAKEILMMSEDRLFGLLEVLELASGMPPRSRARPTPSIPRNFISLPDHTISSDLSSIVTISSSSGQDSDAE